MSLVETNKPPTVTAEMVDIAIAQFQSAREYMIGLIADLTTDEWFFSPAEIKTHIGWQVGHLAVAQYGLMLFRQRGRKLEDSELMAGSFRKLFMKGTTPVAPEKYPQPSEINEVLHRVNEQALREVKSFDPATLNEPCDQPYAAYATRYGAILFASHHEMLHSGQIGMIRRMMGKAPIR